MEHNEAKKKLMTLGIEKQVLNAVLGDPVATDEEKEEAKQKLTELTDEIEKNKAKGKEADRKIKEI